MLKKQRINITDFALRNWKIGQNNAKILGITPEDLVEQCNTAICAGAPLVAGYAKFCKHIFLLNKTATRCSFSKITQENRHLLQSAYCKRRDYELAVLERWFENLVAPVANYLDVILYSYDQLLKESDCFPGHQKVPDCDWGIVGIIGTLTDKEPPLPPITQMRNSLGLSEGGSGVPIDVEKYKYAVEFWQNHAVIK
ncbi:MAG: hypothetical protein TECD_00431 [Hyphomicrobiaceae bacterium hypho_1]